MSPTGAGDSISSSPHCGFGYEIRPKLYYPEVNELLNHSAESGAFVGHKRLLSAECSNLDDLVPLRYTYDSMRSLLTPRCEQETREDRMVEGFFVSLNIHSMNGPCQRMRRNGLY